MARKILGYRVEEIVAVRDALRDEADRKPCMNLDAFDISMSKSECEDAAEMLTRLLCLDDNEMGGCND